MDYSNSDKLTARNGFVQLDTRAGRQCILPREVVALKPHRTEREKTCIILRDKKIFVVSISLDEVREAFDAAAEGGVDHG